MSEKGMTLKLKVWRQKSCKDQGKFVDYTVSNITAEMSFLEMFDILNEDLVKKGEEPIHFDHDCREGICGSCSMVINGEPHGPSKGTTTCQVHMRAFKDGDAIVVEPWRATSFPVLKDLITDRTAMDKLIAAGGFVSVNSGSVQDANCLPIGKPDADRAFDFAACIGCGACVAACKNASANLFVGAKVAQYTLLPQGHPEREIRVLKMVETMDEAGFGACSNTGSCSAVCPKEIPLEAIAKLNCEYMKAKASERPAKQILGD